MFHNSSEKAWGAIQKSIDAAGFSIEGTQTFDKEHGTFKMFVSDNAVGYDLVLHCRKSNALGKHLEEQNVEEVKRGVRKYLERVLLGHDENFVVHYQHVSRADEFDYRRLYAGWLGETLSQQLVSLSFEEFREVVDESNLVKSRC